MTDFKVGDRVRLTGADWHGGGGPQYGDVVTVTGFDSEGDATFLWSDDSDPWVIMGKGWDAELVTDEEERHHIGQDYRNYLLSDPGDTPSFGQAQVFDMPDAIDPGHYKFPGGVEVRHISAHLTSFGGQAVQYVARATRLDGRNKGDTVENLRKAIKFLEWEIERLEAE